VSFAVDGDGKLLPPFSQEQRSQFANRKIARLRLAMLFEQRAQNREVERGNQVRTYRGVKFVRSERDGHPT